MRLESKDLAFSNSDLRAALKPRPARLIKYVSIRMPEAGPFGETFFDARLRAIVAAFLVKSFGGGCVESVVTFDTQRFFLEFAI
jgi:hypothetical protein